MRVDKLAKRRAHEARNRVFRASEGRYTGSGNETTINAAQEAEL